MTSPPLDVGIVLAAGGGTRFGRPKAGVELDGEPLAARAARALREGGCDRVAVVLGPEQVAVDGVDAIVVNADWAEGLGSSLRAVSARAFFGHRVENVLKNAPCPVILLSAG